MQQNKKSKILALIALFWILFSIIWSWILVIYQMYKNSQIKNEFILNNDNNLDNKFQFNTGTIENLETQTGDINNIEAFDNWIKIESDSWVTIENIEFKENIITE